LFFFADQLRRDMLGVNGGHYVETPHIDAFAARGTNCVNAIANCPVCTPYRGMLMTGRYATHSGVLVNFVETSPVQNPNCLANVFARAGYDTGFIGKWHLDVGMLKGNGLTAPDREAHERLIAETGDNAEYTPPGPKRLGFKHWQAFNFHAAFNEYWYYEDEPIKLEVNGFETDVEVDQAIEFMENRRPSSAPFFLTVAPHPPHPPFDRKHVPENYLERISEDIPWAPNVPVDNPRKVLEMRCYLAMVKHLDDAFGRLIEYMDRTHLLENTIVVFTSDHGEMHGSHGRLNKMVPYAESLDVPLIYAWPDHIAAGARHDSVFSAHDHFATLCGLCGLDIPQECDGTDRSGGLLGQSASGPEAALIMNYTSDWNFFQTMTKWPEWRGVRTQRFTYFRWISGEEELYDNSSDPYQMTDLVDDPGSAETLERLRGQLRELLAQAHDEFPPGTAYAEWFNRDRQPLRTGLGPVPQAPSTDPEVL